MRAPNGVELPPPSTTTIFVRRLRAWRFSMASSTRRPTAVPCSLAFLTKPPPSPFPPSALGGTTKDGNASGGGDPLSIPGAFPFRTAQPGELSIQHVDGFGGGLLGQRGRRHDFRRCRDEGAAGALVAGVGPATAGAHFAQLLW